MSSGGSTSTWTGWDGLAEVLSNDTIENADFFAPMANGSACPASGSIRFCQVFGAEVKGISKHDSLKRKHVLKYQESKNLDRAASYAEVVLLSHSPIHFNTFSTSNQNKAHLGFLLQQFSYLLLLFLHISQPFFVNTFCPLSAKS